MSDTLISVKGVSKKFCRTLKKSLWYGMQDLGREITGRIHGCEGELRPDEFWAVNDVSFELKRGECLGLIGRNGAGKTTLLRLLNGLIKPDRGRIEMRGRVGALIALGAGFNPMLTGRENIYVNASVLGLSKQEIDARLDEIIDFAEIGEFIDMPVRSYSSGMNVRLGFAVSSVLDPDVLLLDEVLAVGDTAFRYKCYRRMDELLKKSAVIFVSHDMPMIHRVSTQVLFLAHGNTRHLGDIQDGIVAYNQENSGRLEAIQPLVVTHPPIKHFEVNELAKDLDYRQAFSAKITLESESAHGPVDLVLNIKNLAGQYVASAISKSEEHSITLSKGLQTWNLSFASLPLKPGKYTISFGLASRSRDLLAGWANGHVIEVHGGSVGGVADCQPVLAEWRHA